MKTLQKDLTTGNPGKIIFNFTLPIFIGNVFQQFYSMADTIIVGKFVGTKALAAVVSDQWIYSGNDGRIYRTYGTEIWRG